MILGTGSDHRGHGTFPSHNPPFLEFGPAGTSSQVVLSGTTGSPYGSTEGTCGLGKVSGPKTSSGWNPRSSSGPTGPLERSGRCHRETIQDVLGGPSGLFRRSWRSSRVSPGSGRHKWYQSILTVGRSLIEWSLSKSSKCVLLNKKRIKCSFSSGSSLCTYLL